MKFKKILTKFLACSLAVCSIIGSTITADAANEVITHGNGMPVAVTAEHINYTGNLVYGEKYVWEKGTIPENNPKNNIAFSAGGNSFYKILSKTTDKSTGITTIKTQGYSVDNKDRILWGSKENFKIQYGIKRHFNIGVYSHTAGATNINIQVVTWDVGGANALTTTGLKLKLIGTSIVNGKKVSLYQSNVKIKARNVDGKTTTITFPITYSEVYAKNTKTIATVGSGLNTDIVIGKSAISLKNGVSAKFKTINNVDRYIMINGK